MFYNNILITLEIEKGNIWIEMNMKLNPSDIQVTIKGKGITLVKYRNFYIRLILMEY